MLQYVWGDDMKLKKWIPIFVCIILVVTYIGIITTNNYLAKKIEKDLLEYQLPANTELVDSISVTGKLTGNGNGMQYMGAILVYSDLSIEALKNHYSKQFDFIEVRVQKTANIDYIHAGNYSFNAALEAEGKTYYSVTCWDSNRLELFGEVIVRFLDLDIRGN